MALSLNKTCIVCNKKFHYHYKCCGTNIQSEMGFCSTVCETLADLINMKEFKEGWNGYKANPIPQSVITKTIDLVGQLSPTPKVFPTARESVQLEYDMNDIYIELEIFEDRIEVYGDKENK
jgi:hypothetical protein